MRRSAVGVLAALVLVPVIGGSVALAGPPVTPQITDVSTTWGMRVWDDGVSRCTLIADAVLDPGYTKGPRVYAHVYAHFMWVGEGGGTWQDFNYWNARLSRGATTVHSYTNFDGGGLGYYIVDQVRYDLTSARGEVLSTRAVSTTNTCANR